MQGCVQQTPPLPGSMASIFLTYPPWPGCTTFLTGEDPRSLALNPMLQTPGLLCVRTFSVPVAPVRHLIVKEEEIRSSEALNASLNHLDLTERSQGRDLVNCDGSALIYCIYFSITRFTVQGGGGESKKSMKKCQGHKQDQQVHAGTKLSQRQG